MPTINPIVVKKGTTPTPTTGDYLVKFIDYDGTVLKEEWVDSGNNATAPTSPTHTGLTFVEWNNTFTNVTRDLIIGATYETTDGKTHAFVTLTTVTGLDLTLYMNKSDGSTMTVDWGDSTTDTFTDTGNFNTGAHTYASAGDYEITIWISTGAGTYGFGNDVANTVFVGGNTAAQRNMLTDLWIGDSVTTIHISAFHQCFSLTNVTIPSGVISIGDSSFRMCYSLTNVTIPSSVISIGEQVFNSSGSITNIIIPSGVTSIGHSAFAAGYALTNIIIPSGVTSIDAATFNNCRSLTNVTIPGGVTSIDHTVFQFCVSMLKYVIEATTPPTLANTNAFANINSICKIYVPDASVTAYKTATNWVTYADYFYAISELAGEYKGVIFFDTVGSDLMKHIQGTPEATTDVGDKPTDPELAGNTFEGWFLEDTYNTEFVFGVDSYPVNNITLYAKWEII